MMLNLKEISKECFKGLLLAMNALCMLLAIIMFITAVVDCHIVKLYGEDRALGTFAGDVFIAITCVLLIGVAVLGCVGCIREKAELLYIYMCLLMLLVLLEIFLGIFVAIQRCSLQLTVTDWLRSDFFKNVTDEELADHNKEWDDLQSSWECCGLFGPNDYATIQQPISVSCCDKAYRVKLPSAQQQLYRTCIDNKSYYFWGCENVLLDWLRDSADVWFGLAVVSFWFEAAGALLAMWIANRIKNTVQVYKHTVKY